MSGGPDCPKLASENCSRWADELPSICGHSTPAVAVTVSLAWRKEACAATKLGLAANACSIRLLSRRERNSRHHSPGMSLPNTNRCEAPAATGAEAVSVDGAPGV